MCKLFVFFFITFLLSGCAANKITNNNVVYFKSETGIPDYANLDYWAAHPAKHDPSDSIPKPLLNEIRDTLADVFFLHPTTYTNELEVNKPEWNAAIDDAAINLKTDNSTILYQASIFNNHCRIFAPRYRQAHLSAFYLDSKETDVAFETAYSDLKNAFEYYLANENNGRPIIIAAHSQGSKHALRLLKEFFENKPLQKQLVVAYVVGWPLPVNYFSSLPLCKDAAQTGCVCSWRTFRDGYEPDYVENNKIAALVTNPISWQTNETFIDRKFNQGSVLKDFNKVIKNVTGARVHESVLWIPKPKFPGGFLFNTKNYHIADFNFFYMNIRQNVGTRIAAFKMKPY